MSIFAARLTSADVARAEVELADFGPADDERDALADQVADRWEARR